MQEANMKNPIGAMNCIVFYHKGQGRHRAIAHPKKETIWPPHPASKWLFNPTKPLPDSKGLTIKTRCDILIKLKAEIITKKWTKNLKGSLTNS
jgi:hypothetical protein